LKIIIPVNEGLCYRAGEIKVEDAKLMSSDEALQIIGLKPGDIVKGYSVVQKGLEQIKNYYTEHGYIHFNTDFIPKFRKAIAGTNEATVDLTFDFEEGEAYSVGKIEFEGNITVSEALLRANLLIREGDLYKPSAINETVKRLYNLQLFDDVAASVDLGTHEEERLIDITIRVKEK
jgi:outer membrane protein assembly factor BamA